MRKQQCLERNPPSATLSTTWISLSVNLGFCSRPAITDGTMAWLSEWSEYMDWVHVVWYRLHCCSVSDVNQGPQR